MAWLVGIALAAVAAAVLQQIWAGAGPPWRWPTLISRCETRGLKRLVRLAQRRDAEPVNDPFEILQMQHRLGALASELQRLEAENADDQYWARAHRIHTRKQAYDQLLVQACKLAGVPGIEVAPGTFPTPTGRRSDEERFRDEMELASRGWSW